MFVVKLSSCKIKDGDTLAEKENFLTKLIKPIFVKKKGEESTELGKVFGVTTEKEEKSKPSLGKPTASYKMVIDSPQGGVERYYFWVLRMLEKTGRFGLGFDGKDWKEGGGHIIKVKDLYSSAETSSYWGNIEQKKAAQQDRISQYMANVGKFTKELFQMIRELRILDERLAYYDGVAKKSTSADQALKGIWIDMVEGGSQNVASVYGLANKVGFVTLPDLFFSTLVQKEDDVVIAVKAYDAKGINRKVQEVLGRKLRQFIIWKERTEKELRTRRNFVLAYLVQEYNVIKMYANWLRPYLENARRLQQDRQLNSTDIVTAFETAKVELELIAVQHNYSIKNKMGYNESKTYKKMAPCVRVHFVYTTIPQMSFQQEYQRGAIHTGHTEIKFEAYTPTREQLEEYIKKEDEETFEILTSINETLATLKDELYKYLDEAVKKFGMKAVTSLYPKTEDMEEKSDDSIFTPFKAVFDGFKEVFNIGHSFESKEDSPATAEEEIDESSAAKGVAKLAFVCYDVFKKAFGMFTP
ncbi:MAG: hypothetical protein Q8L27_02885 [archaeon]|nr:hypothetical protein [archaeon]